MGTENGCKWNDEQVAHIYNSVGSHFRYIATITKYCYGYTTIIEDLIDGLTVILEDSFEKTNTTNLLKIYNDVNSYGLIKKETLDSIGRENLKFMVKENILSKNCRKDPSHFLPRAQFLVLERWIKN